LSYSQQSTKKETIILVLSLPLALRKGSVSYVGFYTPGFYHLESFNWKAQSIGQDIMNLFLMLPVLLICASLACGGHRMAKTVLPVRIFTSFIHSLLMPLISISTPSFSSGAYAWTFTDLVMIYQLSKK
jgi:hypothetical protein